MDKLTKYQTAIKETLQEMTKGSYSDPQQLKDVTVFDDVNSRYLIVTQGWDRKDWVNNILVEIDIINTRVLIQCNNTELPVRQYLVEKGIGDGDIIDLLQIK
jgi:hypothetical protein